MFRDLEVARMNNKFPNVSNIPAKTITNNVPLAGDLNEEVNARIVLIISTELDRAATRVQYTDSSPANESRIKNRPKAIPARAGKIYLVFTNSSPLF